MLLAKDEVKANPEATGYHDFRGCTEYVYVQMTNNNNKLQIGFERASLANLEVVSFLQLFYPCPVVVVSTPFTLIWKNSVFDINFEKAFSKIRVHKIRSATPKETFVNLNAPYVTQK